MKICCMASSRAPVVGEVCAAVPILALCRFVPEGESSQ